MLFICSDVQSNKSSMSELKVNDHKRHASASLLDGEDEMLKKRHCSSDKSYEESETSGSTEKRCEAVQSVCVDKNGVCAKGSCEDLVLKVKLKHLCLILNFELLSS